MIFLFTPMWNDTESPLAVFFTFRCYGTWLHGDERGSIDRHHNTYGSPRIPVNDDWKTHNEIQLDRPPVELNARQRKAVEQGLREICDNRRWQISAINVRTNHVHAVICIDGKHTARVLAALKAAATKRLREERLWNIDGTPWAEKGSRRKLWNERSVAEATDYVINRQGKNLSDYDWW
jgi:REP element-mobilizing transposase RayT